MSRVCAAVVRWVAVFGAVFAGFAGCIGPEADCGPAHATVKRVIDGDTIVVSDGRTIRYLLIDAPEATGGHSACYGANASQLNADLVLGRTVALTYDATCRDAYGRTLAYVTVDGRDVNRLLVERGYACVLYIPPSGADRVGEIKALETAARSARRGLWGTCDPVPCR